MFEPWSDDRRIPARETHCMCCDSSITGTYLTSDAGEILRCRDCGYVFLSPWSQRDPVKDLYSETYFKEREDYFFRDGVVDGSGVESPHVQDLRLGLESIESFAAAPGTLLDVGCATGSFMRLAQDRGWDCYGVEVSGFAASAAMEKFGPKVFGGTFSNATFPDGFFDVLTMWDIIEHFPEPREALAKANRLLKTSGLLLVNTPNEQSLTKGTARFLYRASGGRIKRAVNKLYHCYHTSYFTARTLLLLLEKTGFTVIARQTKVIPMSRGRIPPGSKAIIKTLSLAEKLLHAEYEMQFIARKRETVRGGAHT